MRIDAKAKIGGIPILKLRPVIKRSGGNLTLRYLAIKLKITLSKAATLIRWSMAESKSSVLWSRSRDYFKSMQVLRDAGLAENALEAAHLSIEIAMKAVITGKGGTFLEEHNLRNISETLVGGKEVLAEAMRGAGSQVRTDFRSISSAWRMQYRYERLPRNSQEILELLPVFERFYSWIVKQFVNS